MDDLTITRLCAEAMGYLVVNESQKEYERIGRLEVVVSEGSRAASFLFGPLHDDAQCMALVKKMKLGIEPGSEGEDYYVYSTEVAPMVREWNIDLNRAVCECVARMQQAKG